MLFNMAFKKPFGAEMRHTGDLVWHCVLCLAGLGTGGGVLSSLCRCSPAARLLSLYSELFVFIATCQRWATVQGRRAALEVPWWAQVIMNGGSVALERARADGVTGCSPSHCWCAQNWGLVTNPSVMASHPSPAATQREEISSRLAVSANTDPRHQAWWKRGERTYRRIEKDQKDLPVQTLNVVQLWVRWDCRCQHR